MCLLAGMSLATIEVRYTVISSINLRRSVVGVDELLKMTIYLSACCHTIADNIYMNFFPIMTFNDTPALITDCSYTPSSIFR